LAFSAFQAYLCWHQNIKCKVLALQGTDDPFVPAKDLGAFEDEMRQAKLVFYSANSIVIDYQ
jgi:dienelactone hydrolase